MVNGQIYHIYNRSVDLQPIFTKERENYRAIDCLSYYRFKRPPIRFSHFLAKGKEARQEFLDRIGQSSQQAVQVLAFCLMPNHFHLLLKQLTDGAISRYLGLFQNSCVKYFNIKNQRHGSLFQGQFKSVIIETDEQLMHVSRYIHLNPYSSYVVRSFNGLLNYPWSSLPEYLGQVKNGLCLLSPVISLFKDSPEKYLEFVKDNADYQRTLDKIKHLIDG